MQETPVSPPAPQVPQTPPNPGPAPQTPPPAPAPAPQGEQVSSFYSPQTPAPYVATPEEHNLPKPYAAPDAITDPQTLAWEASEYVHTDKGSMWLIGFGIIVLAVAGVALWLQAWTFLVLVVVMAVAMGVFAFRPPHVLHYTLNENGVQIADKTFHYSDFRAFGILEDGAFFTMTLIPIKRFAPSLSVYFAEDQGEQIVDIVSAHLPMEHIEPDVIDHLMRRLRF